MIEVYIDASGGKRIIGLGAVVLVDGREVSRLGTAAKPGRTTTEAEFLAVFWGIDLITSLMESRVLEKGDGVLFHTDSTSVIDSIYEINKTRSKTSKRLAKRILTELDDMRKTESIKFFRFTLVKGALNKADTVSKKSRHRWTNRIKLERKSSGAS